MRVFPYHVRDYSLNTNVMQAGAPITFVKKEDEDTLRTLGGRVKWAREKRGLSQSALGKQAGVSQGTIGNLESGAMKQPRALLAIANALRVNPDWLESRKGDWEAAKGAVFEVLTDEERAMLDNFRRLLDKQRQAKADEIAALAQQNKEMAAELFAKFGVSSPESRAARVGNQAIARASVEAGKPASPQKSLFDPEGKDK